MDQIELSDKFIQTVRHRGCRRVRRGHQTVAVVFVSLSRVTVADNQLVAARRDSLT
jgi:hypothetical protein